MSVRIGFPIGPFWISIPLRFRSRRRRARRPLPRWQDRPYVYAVSTLIVGVAVVASLPVAGVVCFVCSLFTFLYGWSRKR
jgi:hypothetical protein